MSLLIWQLFPCNSSKRPSYFQHLSFYKLKEPIFVIFRGRLGDLKDSFRGEK